ncbi:hypothetical protein RCC89_09355 [Cytophagaceae bacterium ABcell3]|nr:hypothetical protein RCC89_09355 [Cytophagaceae bacterium ABcell3]
MKHFILKFLLCLVCIGFISGSTAIDKKTLGKTLSELNDVEKKEVITDMLKGNCSYKDIKLYGKVTFVKSFPDIKIQYVKSFPDIKVQFVDNFPNKCGQWQKVDNFPDFKVQVVDQFPDIKVQVVDSFPGMD